MPRSGLRNLIHMLSPEELDRLKEDEHLRTSSPFFFLYVSLSAPPLDTAPLHLAWTSAPDHKAVTRERPKTIVSQVARADGTTEQAGGTHARWPTPGT